MAHVDYAATFVPVVGSNVTLENTLSDKISCSMVYSFIAEVTKNVNTLLSRKSSKSNY